MEWRVARAIAGGVDITKRFCVRRILAWAHKSAFGCTHVLMFRNTRQCMHYNSKSSWQQRLLLAKVDA